MRKSAIFMLFLAFLLLATCPGMMRAGVKSNELNDRYRNIAEKMKELYEGGELYQVIDLYKKQCCEAGAETGEWKAGKEKKEFKKVKKEIRADIYQPLALSLIALHRPELGEIYIRKILVLRRDEGTGKYWLSIREIARNRYYVAPRFLVGVNLGVNFTFVHPGERYMVLVPVDPGKIDSYQKDYSFNLSDSRGTQYGLVLEYALTKHLSITIQPAFSSMKFRYKNRFTREDETGQTATTLDYTHRHKLGYLEIPLLFKYRFIKPKFKPYLQVGVYYSMLQTAIKTLNAVSLPDQEYREQAIVDIKQLLTRSNLGIRVGLGVDYDIGDFRLQVEANYKFGFNNIVDKANRFGNEQLMFAFYDVFDDMKLRNWELSVKLLLPISYKAFRR